MCSVRCRAGSAKTSERWGTVKTTGRWGKVGDRGDSGERRRQGSRNISIFSTEGAGGAGVERDNSPASCAALSTHVLRQNLLANLELMHPSHARLEDEMLRKVDGGGAEPELATTSARDTGGGRHDTSTPIHEFPPRTDIQSMGSRRKQHLRQRRAHLDHLRPPTFHLPPPAHGPHLETRPTHSP
jgi:hypothetical protein